MKTIFLILFSILLLSSCHRTEPVNHESVTLKGYTEIENDNFYSYMREFEYKGHIYIACSVNGGVAPSHAGHCWCNPNAVKPSVEQQINEQLQKLEDIKEDKIN